MVRRISSNWMIKLVIKRAQTGNGIFVDGFQVLVDGAQLIKRHPPQNASNDAGHDQEHQPVCDFHFCPCCHRRRNRLPSKVHIASASQLNTPRSIQLPANNTCSTRQIRSSASGHMREVTGKLPLIVTLLQFVPCKRALQQAIPWPLRN